MIILLVHMYFIHAIARCRDNQLMYRDKLFGDLCTLKSSILVPLMTAVFALVEDRLTFVR